MSPNANALLTPKQQDILANIIAECEDGMTVLDGFVTRMPYVGPGTGKPFLFFANGKPKPEGAAIESARSFEEAAVAVREWWPQYRAEHPNCNVLLWRLRPEAHTYPGGWYIACRLLLLDESELKGPWMPEEKVRELERFQRGVA